MPPTLVGGGVNNTGGNNCGGGGGGKRSYSFFHIESYTRYYTFNPVTGIYKINDPYYMVSTTGGRFDPHANYINTIFFVNASHYLTPAKITDPYGEYLPRSLDPTQLRFLQDAPLYHFNHVEHPGVTHHPTPPPCVHF